MHLGGRTGDTSIICGARTRPLIERMPDVEADKAIAVNVKTAAIGSFT